MILFGLLLFLPLVVLAALLKSILRLFEEIFLPSYVEDSSPKQARPKKTKK
jgi:uncharacterized membrane protein